MSSIVNGERPPVTPTSSSGKARPETTLAEILAPKIFKKNPADTPIKSFDVTQVRKEIAEKTHQAVSCVLGFGAYEFTTVQSHYTIGERLKMDKDKFIQKMNGLRDTDSNAFRVGLRFIQLIGKIHQSLKKKSSEFNFQDVKALRKNVSSALELMKENEGLFKEYPGFAQLLQALSYQIKTQVKGMSILQMVGSEALSWCKDSDHPVTAKSLSNRVEEVFYRMPVHDWDSFFHMIKWIVSHPKQAFFGFIDQNIPGAHVHYNSYDQGNIDIAYGYIQVDDKKIQMQMGAGLMNDRPLSAAAMDWGILKGDVQVAGTLEHHGEGEHARLSGLQELVDEKNKRRNSPAVILKGATHDKKFNNFQDIKTIKGFHEELMKEGLDRQNRIPKLIKDYMGYVIPKGLLSKEDISNAIAFSVQALTAALGNGELKSDFVGKHHHQRLCSAMMTCFNAFLDIQMLINLGKMLKDDEISGATYSTVCKQCFDRGPLANATLIAFVKLIENGELEVEDENQVVSILTGRTIMGGADRKMIKDRRQAFIDLFKIIGHTGEGEKGFIQALKEFVGETTIKFVPSS